MVLNLVARLVGLSRDIVTWCYFDISEVDILRPCISTRSHWECGESAYVCNCSLQSISSVDSNLSIWPYQMIMMLRFTPRGSLRSEASDVQAQTQTSYKSRRTISKMASFMVRSARNATLTRSMTRSECYGSRVPNPERGWAAAIVSSDTGTYTLRI